LDGSMAPSQNAQLEKVVDEVLKSGDVKALGVFLQGDTIEGPPFRCSQQFLTKLDKLISRSLERKESKSASLGLGILYKCGGNLKLPGGGQGLSGLIAQGLVKKMVQWFEKCRQMLIQCGPQWDETLFNLCEDFFEALMVVHEACKEGTYKITECFMSPIGQLAVDPRIYILIQKEAIRKFNFILDKIPAELKKKRKFLTSQEASDIMLKIAGQILDGGDYDLQTALMEALCRMATLDQRKELAVTWFNMEYVASAFIKISDSEFETDCRKFLNLVNGIQGEKRRVFSYPCLEAYLDKNELLMPADEKLEEFWIDFNLGSRSISFYFSLADEEMQEGQWETICINENEVKSYTVKEEGKTKVLQLKLSEVVVVGAVEGSSLTIHFSSSLDIRQAAHSVYGHRKDNGFVGKTSTSVVKTTVKIIMEENSSQVVPESQVSLGEIEKNTAPYLLPAPSAPVQMVTPARMRISESITLVSGSGGGSVRGAGSLSAVMPSNTSAKGKGKPNLVMIRSSDRQGDSSLGERMTKNGSTSETIASGMKKQNMRIKATDMTLSGQEEEQCLDQTFVPDSQPRSERKMSAYWNKFSVSEMLIMPTQKVNYIPRIEPSNSEQKKERLSSAQRMSVPVNSPISQKKLHTELTQRLKTVLNERNHDPAPQEPAAPKKKLDTREDSKRSVSSDQWASKEQKVKRIGPARQKSKDKLSFEPPAAQTKAPAKASTSKGVHEKILPDVKAQTDKALSRKEKRDAAVAGSMVKVISSHYETKTQSTAKDLAENIAQGSIPPPNLTRKVFDMGWLPTTTKKESGAVSRMKPNSKTTTVFTRQREDIFAFSIDEPLIIGGKDKTFNNTSTMSSSGINDSSALFKTTRKEQPVQKEKRHVKKHLFSDTDTDYAMTEVSWLRESSRKPKPKVTKYSRQPNAKPKHMSPHTSSVSPDVPSPSQKQVKRDTKPHKKKPAMKARVEHPKKTVKPAVAASSPHAAGRRSKRAAATSCKSYREPDSDEESEKPKAFKPKDNPCSSTTHLEKRLGAAEVIKKTTDGKQPTKSYMKLESYNNISLSESVSELTHTSKKYFADPKNKKTSLEVQEVKKRKETSMEKSAEASKASERKKLLDLKNNSGFKQRRLDIELPETLNKKMVAPAEELTRSLKDWVAGQTSFCLSPPFIDRMRSAERSAPTLDLTCSPLLTPRGSPLPASPDPPCRDTPSPILLLPKPRSTVSSRGNFKPLLQYRGNAFHSAEKKRRSSKTPSIRSVSSNHSLTPRGQTPAPGNSSGPRAPKYPPSLSESGLPLSDQPLLTSTLLELDKPSMPSPHQSPFTEDAIQQDYYLNFSKVSSVSLSQSSTKSSVHNKRAKDSPTSALAVSHKREKTPNSDQDHQPAQLHVSGPSRKRRMSLSSNSEEDEEEERMKSTGRGQHSPRMKPRKLFKSYTEMSVESEVSHVMSTSHTMSSSHWDAETGDGDMDMEEELELPKMALNPNNLCQQFSTELKKKFQNRHEMVEVYNKQSLKTVQQHVSSLNMQVTKFRKERLEKVRTVLLEEIHKLEQDETVLKSMEKDLTMYWKKQITEYHSYNEHKTRRNDTLAKFLQSNVCPSLEYEEKIFTSQMCLIRRDMKSVQDTLLSQMQEGEIQSVKRGLHALFFP
ncbi:synaptonemal complex protein 2, partial [Labrus bergylta]|uniref:synaptonemal complex protein 2 n=1 Tax=Labrus bergylta TaxID=56723 RepID=UPI0033134478